MTCTLVVLSNSLMSLQHVYSWVRIDMWIGMIDFNSIENSDTEQNCKHDEKFKTNIPEKIVKTDGNVVSDDTQLIGTTDLEQETSEILEENVVQRKKELAGLITYFNYAFLRDIIPFSSKKFHKIFVPKV